MSLKLTYTLHYDIYSFKQKKRKRKEKKVDNSLLLGDKELWSWIEIRLLVWASCLFSPNM